MRGSRAPFRAVPGAVTSTENVFPGLPATDPVLVAISLTWHAGSIKEALRYTHLRYHSP
jgi:hypothetical protein